MVSVKSFKVKIFVYIYHFLSTAFQIVLSIKYLTNADEESVNVFMWLIDKALHHEAFIQQTAHLKELKYKMQRVKMSFTHNKLHYNSNSKANNNKIR